MPINGTPHAVDAMLRRTEAQVEWKESGWLHLAALGCAMEMLISAKIKE